jgi:hypothetical protein
MNLLNIVKSVLNLEKKIDVKTLPSQGLFYKEYFSIKIKKANIEDIIEYEQDFIKDNVGLIIYKIKKIVRNNIIIENGYSFNDIKSIDIVYLFLEIVKFTKNESVKFKYFDESVNMEKVIEFESKYFNYFNIDEKLMSMYNSIDRCFDIDGYRYSLPSIGVEDSLTNYLISKSNLPNSQIYNTYFYDFTHFILDKNTLTFSEIENLIQIFNFDIDEKELNKIKSVVEMFIPLQRYSLIEKGKVIDINAKIDLEKIWK